MFLLFLRLQARKRRVRKADQQHAELHNWADPLLLHGGASSPYSCLPICPWQPCNNLIPCLLFSDLYVHLTLFIEQESQPALLHHVRAACVSADMMLAHPSLCQEQVIYAHSISDALPAELSVSTGNIVCSGMQQVLYAARRGLKLAWQESILSTSPSLNFAM